MESYLRLIVLITCSLCQLSAQEYAPSVPKPTKSEIVYGKHDRNILDFWKAESETPTPVAFVIHGGGWKGGSASASTVLLIPKPYFDVGIPVVAINYRYVTNEENPPVKAPLHDAARALCSSFEVSKYGT